MINQLRYLIFILLCTPLVCSGQGNADGTAALKRVMNTIKNTQNISYKYDLSVLYPNGQSDRMKGDLFIDNIGMIMYNSSNYSTILYTGKWTYKADHSTKEITLVDNEKHLSKENKMQTEKEIFQNVTASIFIDSVILRKAIVKKYLNSNDTTFIEVGFPDEMFIKSIILKFNDREGKLISYNMITFRPWEDNTFGKNKGTRNTINCSNFIKGIEKNAYKTDKFFLIENGKVILKKYANYKVIAKI